MELVRREVFVEADLHRAVVDHGASHRSDDEAQLGVSRPLLELPTQRGLQHVEGDGPRGVIDLSAHVVAVLQEHPHAAVDVLGEPPHRLGGEHLRALVKSRDAQRVDGHQLVGVTEGIDGDEGAQLLVSIQVGVGANGHQHRAAPAAREGIERRHQRRTRIAALSTRIEQVEVIDEKEHAPVGLDLSPQLQQREDELDHALVGGQRLLHPHLARARRRGVAVAAEVDAGLDLRLGAQRRRDAGLLQGQRGREAHAEAKRAGPRLGLAHLDVDDAGRVLDEGAHRVELAEAALPRVVRVGAEPIGELRQLREHRVEHHREHTPRRGLVARAHGNRSRLAGSSGSG
ncbi:MAG: hypothetical protein U0325_00450 [Polyangiales bacterium]